jgi:hypothetical protein
VPPESSLCRLSPQKHGSSRAQAFSFPLSRRIDFGVSSTDVCKIGAAVPHCGTAHSEVRVNAGERIKKIPKIPIRWIRCVVNTVVIEESDVDPESKRSKNPEISSKYHGI